MYTCIQIFIHGQKNNSRFIQMTCSKIHYLSEIMDFKVSILDSPLIPLQSRLLMRTRL